MKTARAFSLRQIFAAPAVIGIMSLIGLVGALIGDGAWDVVGWLALAAPVAAIILARWLRRA